MDIEDKALKELVAASELGKTYYNEDRLINQWSKLSLTQKEVAHRLVLSNPRKDPYIIVLFAKNRYDKEGNSIDGTMLS